MKIKKDYLDYAYLGFFFLVVFSFITGTLVSTLGYSMVVIENPDPNSMWPTYFQGDLFILEEAHPDDIDIGDVLVYESVGGVRIIHRVIDKIQIEGLYYFRVKGDNAETNNQPDGPGFTGTGSTLIKETSVLGKITFRIPYLGHLSLAMQNNAGIQVFVYFIAILLGIAIVFWPEDEDDEEKSKEDEFLEVTADIIKSALKAIIYYPITIFRETKASKYTRIYLIFSVVIVFLLFIPTVVPSFVYTANTPDGIGISGVELGKITNQYTETMEGQTNSYSFTQLKVTIYDNSGLWKRITGFTINVFTIKDKPDTLISSTKWKSLRDFKGSVTIGGSIVIHSNNQPTNNTPIFVQIKLKWVEYFIEKTIVENYELIYHIP